MSIKHLKYYDVPFLTPFSFEGRAHKLCKLPNGILTLLISDPTENSSACSLTVATGSYNDPLELPGLAHLCEHMILAAGSRKYPDPGLYHEKIVKNGGSQNAFTTGEQTTFYFELPNIYHSLEKGFEEALDIFGSFFVDPLFNSTIINKETYAIESEHDLNTSSISKVLYHGTRLLANDKHPFSRFSTGNISTLNSIPHLKGYSLKALLHEYFRENFCASKMTLCLRGPQSIHSLAKLAANHFSQIRTTPFHARATAPRSPIKWKRLSFDEADEDGVVPEKMKILRDTWLPKYQGHLCFIPDQEQKVLLVKSSKNPVVRFVFPAVEKSTRFTSKDMKLMAHIWPELLGDESPGSFSHWLTTRSWVTCCFAFVSEIASGNLALILELDLTKSGLQNLSCITAVLLRQVIPTFTQKYTLELAQFLSEQNSIDLIRFLYQSAEISPMEECAKMSCLLQDDLEALNPSCIFRGFPMFIDLKNQVLGNYGEGKESDNWWIGQAIKFQNFLKQFMTFSNMRIVLCSDIPHSKFGSSEPVTDLFYEFEYSKCKNLKNGLNDLATEYAFSVPPTNVFLPTLAQGYHHLKDMLIESSEKSDSVPLSFTVQNRLHKTVPHLVSQNCNHEMWVMPESEDASLHLKCIVSFEIFGLDLEPSPENTMNLEILGQIISILISPEIYPSLKLGFTCEVTPSNKGDVRLRFTISGFSEQLITVVISIVEIIKKVCEDPNFPSKETLRRARILVRNNYEGAANENCANVASIGLYIVLERYMWTLEDRLDALEEIDVLSFKKFCSSFIESTKYLSLFVQGDLSCADEINGYLHKNFTHHLTGGIYETCGKTFLVKTTKILESGTNICVQHKGQKDDPNNSIVYFIQTGNRNDRNIFSLTSFTAHLMSLTLAPELRNKRQVGYLVVGGLRLLSDSVGLHITIMSSGSPLDLENKIEEYLWYLGAQIEKLNEEKFQEEYVGEYMKLLDGDSPGNLNESSGPSDLLNELVANVQIGDSEVLSSPVMKRHKRLQSQIIQEDYDFISQIEAVDAHLIADLSLVQYLTFFKRHIAVKSMERSKISIMISSSMAETEVINRRIFLQLETFLKIKGFAIPADQLREIVEKTRGKPRNLAMELYNSFRTRNEARRLCSAVLAELFKMLAMTLRHRYGSLARDDTSKQDAQEWNSDVKSALDLVLLEDVNFFKKVQL